MDKPLIHPKTETELIGLAASDQHAVALVGPYGAGKGTLADWLSVRLLGKSRPTPQQLMRVSPESGSIGIDDVRGVQHFLRLKSAGTSAIRRVVIIEDAQTMTTEAQNALLKSLEEPPEDTRIILSVTTDRALLSTIRSRLRVIHVLPISLDQTISRLAAAGNETAIRRAHALSGGYAGLLTALLSDDGHSLKSEVEAAKQLLRRPVYERLLTVNDLAKDKDKAALLLFALKRVLSAALTQSLAKPDDRQTAKLLTALASVLSAEAALMKNPNLKLLMTDVMLSL